MNGMDAALEMWKGLSDKLADKMKKEIVTHSVSAFLEGDQLFRTKLENAEKERKVAEDTVSREQKLLGKGGKRSDVIKALRTQRETRAAAEETARKEEDEEFYRTHMHQDGSGAGMPVSPPSQQLQVMLFTQNTQQLEQSKKQADKKAEPHRVINARLG